MDISRSNTHYFAKHTHTYIYISEAVALSSYPKISIIYRGSLKFSFQEYIKLFNPHKEIRVQKKSPSNYAQAL
jgi:hypothetical protein